MSAPLKPWEVAGVNNRLAAPGSDVIGGSLPVATSGGVVRTSVLAPDLPPRPTGLQTSSYSAYHDGYSSGYGGLNSYRGYGMGGYGMGGYGMGSYGMGGYGAGLGGYGGYGSYGGFGQFGGGMFGNVESRFIQLAEESSRPAFQSIQSVVGAVGSVAMMLENTFIAITSSFRAILGVADNFGRLRSLFAQLWSAFAVFRGINWLFKKLLVMIGVRNEDEFKAWAEAQSLHAGAQGQGQEPHQDSAGRSSWPVLLFLGVITAAPYIISKLLGSITSTINSTQSDPTSWQNPLRALAQYDFTATSPQEISFRANQIVTIAPEAVQGTLWQSGWLVASVDNKHSGLIPANYVKLFRQQPPVAPPAPPPPPTIDTDTPAGAKNEGVVAESGSGSGEV